MINVQNEMVEMQRKKDACLYEVQRLTIDQQSIQTQSADLLAEIETSLITLNCRQDHLTSWEQDTRKEIDDTRQTAQWVTEEMKTQ